MKIAIIGAGNVGSALAKGFAKAGHELFIGARNLQSAELRALAAASPNIQLSSIAEAVASAEVVLFSTPPDVAVEIAGQYPALRDRIIIDATNSVFRAPAPYANAFEGIKAKSGCQEIAKCFNSTGFENMANPVYHDEGIDMFVAGSSARAKSVASHLACEIGFSQCFDFGGDDKVALLEQLAMCWINLAIMQGQGRDIAFKVIRR